MLKKAVFIKDKEHMVMIKRNAMGIIFILLFLTLIILLCYAGYMYYKVPRAFRHAQVDLRTVVIIDSYKSGVNDGRSLGYYIPDKQKKQ